MQIEIQNAVTIEAETLGEQENPLVLLVSGAGAPSSFWPFRFREAIASSGFFVVSYCHRDTGCSTHFTSAYGIKDLLGDLEQLLAYFQPRNVHIVGHSMGGYLALMAACSVKRRFSSVCSISAGPTVDAKSMKRLGMTSPTDETWATLMQNMPSGVYEKDLPGWLKSWKFLNGSRPFDYGMAEQYTQSLYSTSFENWRVADNHIHAMTTLPKQLADDLTRLLSCPLLVLHGSEDPLVPPNNGIATAKLVEHAKLHLLAGAGHMFFHDSIWSEIFREIDLHLRSSE